MRESTSGFVQVNVLLALMAALTFTALAESGGEKAVQAVRLDPEKLAGVNLSVGEPFISADDIVEGNHRPRGDVLFYGEELILEVYEDDAATFRLDDPFPFDEYILVLDGKLVLTAADGVKQEFVAGDSLVLPKGFTGTWEMQGNYRELVAIERKAYEAAF